MSSRNHILVLAVSTGVWWTISFLYSTKINPEISFWKAVSYKQNSWIQAYPDADKRYVFIGGSSCVFSIQPTLLKEEFGLTAVNAGSFAGTGRLLHLDIGNCFLRDGDTLILNFESNFWTETQQFTSVSAGSILWHGHYRKRSPSPPLSTHFIDGSPYPLSDVRPGGYHCFTMMLKVALKRDIFRYKESDIQEGGYTTTSYREEQVYPRRDIIGAELSDTARIFLLKLKTVLAERRIDIAVNIPWCYTAEDRLELERQNIRQLISQIEEICPVLEDPYDGCRSERSVFADTGWHLSEDAAQERTRIVGRSFQKLATEVSLLDSAITEK